MRSFFLSLVAPLIFLAGVLLQLWLSGSVVAAQIDASSFGTQSQEVGLRLSCPIMLSPSESGLVRATVTNPMDELALPVITAEISRVGGMQTVDQTLSLAPRETQTIQWTVDASNAIPSRPILVDVVQARYRDLDPHQGFCGILVFSLFNLSGTASLILIIVAGLALILLGGTLWWRRHTPLTDLAEETMKACGALAGVTTLALLTALPRWWGLTLAMDALAVIIMGVIFTDFVLFPKRGRR